MRLIDGDQLEQRLLDEAARIMADDLYGKDRQRLARGLQKAAEICRATETAALQSILQPIVVEGDQITKIVMERLGGDAEPVKHGRWVPLYDDVWVCSECEQAEQFAENIESTSRYCPNCGALMDKEADDEID